MNPVPDKVLARRYHEDILRYYIKNNPERFGLDCIKGTNIVGTPDIPALRNGKLVKIELKTSGKNVAHQIRTKKLHLIDEVWFLYDNITNSQKRILKEHNITMKNISSIIDFRELDNFQEIFFLTQDVYHIDGFLWAIKKENNVRINFLQILKNNNLDLKYKYDKDKIFDELYNTRKKNIVQFEKLVKLWNEIKEITDAERIKLAKRRKEQQEAPKKEIKTLYCKSCGKEIAADFIFCKYCGEKQ